MCAQSLSLFVKLNEQLHWLSSNCHPIKLQTNKMVEFESILILSQLKNRGLSNYLWIIYCWLSSTTSNTLSPNKLWYQNQENELKYLCGDCEKAVKWGTSKIKCNTCHAWYHTECLVLIDRVYKALKNKTWDCIHCGVSESSKWRCLSSLLSQKQKAPVCTKK